MLNSKAFLAVKPLPSSSPKTRELFSAKTTLAAVQIMCGQFLFELNNLKYDIYAFDESQKVVYAKSATFPLFDAYHTVNMEWTLHCLNFFRHHMMKEDAMTLYSTMASMPIGDRPSAWRGPLKEGAYPLSKFWKGTYAYLDERELSRIRKLSKGKKGRDSDGIWFEDKNIEHGGNIQVSLYGAEVVGFSTRKPNYPRLYHHYSFKHLILHETNGEIGIGVRFR